MVLDYRVVAWRSTSSVGGAEFDVGFSGIS